VSVVRCGNCKEYVSKDDAVRVGIQSFCDSACQQVYRFRKPKEPKKAFQKKKRLKYALKRCVVCGEDYEPTGGTQKFCSASCSDLSPREKNKNRPMVSCVCERCGKTFSRRADQVSRNPHTYCSPYCANLMPRTRKGPPKTGGIISCEICGKEFYVSGFRLESARFCSQMCNGVWTRSQPRLNFIGSADNTGKKNGRYKHGKRVGTNTNKRIVRSAVIERDGDWCLVCGQPPKGLHLHRIRFGSEGGRYAADNCVQLCGLHHDTVHRGPKHVWQDLLKEYISRTTSTEENHGDWLRDRVASLDLLFPESEHRPRDN
jgi:hypothetical protein